MGNTINFLASDLFIGKTKKPSNYLSLDPVQEIKCVCRRSEHGTRAVSHPQVSSSELKNWTW